MPKLKKKTNVYRTGLPDLQQAADRQFEKLEARKRSLKDEMFKTVADILVLTAREFLQVTRLLTGEPHLADFAKQLSEGIQSKDLTVVGSATRDLLATFDRSSINFADESPESHLVAALVSFDDSVGEWAAGNFEQSQENSVRARSSLRRI